MTEYDDSYVDRAKYRKLMRLLEKAAFAFEESTVDNGQSPSNVFVLVAAYTDRLRSSLIALISIFRRPIVYVVGACVAFIQTTGGQISFLSESSYCLLRVDETRGWGGRGSLGNKGPLSLKRRPRFFPFVSCEYAAPMTLS
jgi:hypothetical protein